MGYQARETDSDRRAQRRGEYDRSLLRPQTSSERARARNARFAEPANIPVPRTHAGKKSKRVARTPYRKAAR